MTIEVSAFNLSVDGNSCLSSLDAKDNQINAICGAVISNQACNLFLTKEDSDDVFGHLDNVLHHFTNQIVCNKFIAELTLLLALSSDTQKVSCTNFVAKFVQDSIDLFTGSSNQDIDKADEIA